VTGLLAFYLIAKERSCEYDVVFSVNNFKISLCGLFTQYVKDLSLGTRH